MLKLCVVVMVVVGMVMAQDCGYDRGMDQCSGTLDALVKARETGNDDARCAALAGHFSCIREAYSHCPNDVQKDVFDSQNQAREASGC